MNTVALRMGSTTVPSSERRRYAVSCNYPSARWLPLSLSGVTHGLLRGPAAGPGPSRRTLKESPGLEVVKRH